MTVSIGFEAARSVLVEACRIAGFPYVPPARLLACMLQSNKADRLLCHAVRLDPEVHAVDLDSIERVVQALYLEADVTCLQLGG